MSQRKTEPGIVRPSLTVRLQPQLLERLRAASLHTRVAQTDIVEEALTAWLFRHDARAKRRKVA